MKVRPHDARLSLVHLLVAGTLALAAVLTPLACDGPGDEARRPDLLMVVVESQGMALGCYGDAEASTPRIDAVANSGLVFHGAEVDDPDWRHTWGTLLGGEVPADCDTATVTAAAASFGDRFRTAGYRVGLIGDIHPAALDRGPMDFVAATEDASALWRLRQLDRFLDDDDGRPWCLVLHLRPDPELSEPSGSPTDRTPKALRSDALSIADRAVGAVLDRLVDRAMADHLVGIYTAGACPQSEDTHPVPLVAFGKSVRGGTCEDTVAPIDVLPTMLDLAGASLEGLAGRSFAAALGTDAAPR